ncbi:MAG: LysM peptidoglycan-binding domain-containing protein [Anaerolineae bacterium]
MESRTRRVCLTAIILAGLLLAGGCTRDRPLPTPTPTATVHVVPATPSPTAPPVITPDVPEVTYHTVKPGETLWDIAKQYGVTMEALVAANELLDPDALEPGQRLVIPEGEDTSGEASATAGPTPSVQDEEGGQRTHTVAAGDTLWSIALEYGTTVDEIARLNDIDPEGILTLGQQLRIP